MIINGIEIDDALYAETKARYEFNMDKGCRGMKITFDQLVVEITSARPLGEIAEAYDFSKTGLQRLRQIYLTGLLPESLTQGRIRRFRAVAGMREEAREKQLCKGPADIVIEAVTSAGFKTEPISPALPGMQKSKCCLINGYRCFIRQVGKLFKPEAGDRREYGAFSLPKKVLVAFDFCIIVTKFPERRSDIYYIPCGVFLEHWGAASEEKFFYLPAGKGKPQGAINWAAYKNAVNFLGRST